jgi:cytochrome c oxidase subunit 2
MRSYWIKWSRFLVVLATSLSTIALAGCASTHNILAPFSPAASETANLFYFVFWIAVVIFILVEGLLVWFVLRYQRRAQNEVPEQYHGNTRLEVTWTVIPALILMVVFALTIRTMGQAGPASAPAQGLPIKVVGHQWWWEIQYNDGKVLTASDLHIPAGQVVNIVLNSDNVIHSFWVPALMGKTDVVPTHDNKTWLMSSIPGTYAGQCAEFCGAQHAHMLFQVIVQPQAEFQTWLNNQAQPPAEPAAGSLAAQGKDLLLNPRYLCVGCHTVNGTTAKGVTGPNLTHVASRSCFAGCMFEFNHDNLTKWLTSPQAMKPDTIMKIPQLTPDEINALTAYVESLK